MPVSGIRKFVTNAVQEQGKVVNDSTPSSLCGVQGIPEERCFGIITNPIFLHPLLVYTSTRVLTAHPIATRL
ncbi:GDSL esterase/lipase [Senna tora]|uniref:GDSL esterase/lipase n=1 Tax=Senna tora TaxID=362788 RepID=A0A834TC78_9FABA|nr:GDSL esterase/lipase [Senna tora]